MGNTAEGSLCSSTSPCFAVVDLFFFVCVFILYIYILTVSFIYNSDSIETVQLDELVFYNSGFFFFNL